MSDLSAVIAATESMSKATEHRQLANTSGVVSEGDQDFHRWMADSHMAQAQVWATLAVVTAVVTK